MSEVKKIATRESYEMLLWNWEKSTTILWFWMLTLRELPRQEPLRRHFRNVTLTAASRSEHDGNRRGPCHHRNGTLRKYLCYVRGGRAFEQVRNSIGYPHLNVKIGATHAASL